MEEQRYLKILLSAIIALVIATVCYGTFLNESNRQHIQKIEDARYIVLPAVRAEYKNIRLVIDVSQITARNSWTLDVTAQYEGVIDNLNVEVGQYVEGGQILATMNNTALSAQIAAADASITEAKANLINFNQIANRYKILSDQDAISAQDFDSAISQRDAAQAQLDNRIAQRDILISDQDKLTVSAPQSAEVIRVYRSRGDYVRAGEPILMLADFSTLNAITILTHDQTKNFQVQGSNFFLEIPNYQLAHKAYPIFNDNISGNTLNHFPITVERITPPLDKFAQYHEITFRVINHNGLMEPTYYNDVKIFSTKDTKILAVPSNAVHNDGDNFFVYLLDDSECLTKQIISVGFSNDELIEVTSGIQPGTLVILTDDNDFPTGTKVRINEK